ncbi:hypothetical protein T11_10716 [Trichinella zimbabwensis]|uniref:Uncharacterized protein n=1 Tax=Trichinella zimbabwensis TaxID=268475 RepID=A0A0V1GE89_9BILA|nr:hypothetical protein T11_10716 [Trichinella zimbabwensis]
MPPLLKCKHPGSILREFQRGCYPNGIVYDESLQYTLMYRYLAEYYKKGENYEKKIFTKNVKTAKSIAHEISKFSKILFFAKNKFNGSEKIRELQRTWSHVP